MVAKQARLAKEAAEEDSFRRAMLDKFAMDDKLEQMNAQKRRMRQQEHKREVETLIQERRARKEFEAQQVLGCLATLTLALTLAGELGASRATSRATARCSQTAYGGRRTAALAGRAC